MPAAAQWRHALTRPLVASAVLMGVYLALSLAMDPRGYLGTDTGAKVATLDAMDRGGTVRPDVGYWAEVWDPDGAVHPFRGALRTDDGSWVAVTTLPIIEIARPLYTVGGYRAVLLLPMLGSLLCAHSARLLARRLRPDREWAAFWVVGACSPMLIYALDFWEHSLGVGLVLAAVVLVVDIAGGAPPLVRGLAAGVLLGLAATMRTEALVYALVLIGLGAATALWRRRVLGPPVLAGVASVIGFGGIWLVNRALEVGADGVSRAARASQAAEAAATGSASRADDRIVEALVTSLGAKGEEAASWVLGLAIVLVLVFAVRAHRRGDDRLAGLCFVLAGIVYLSSAIRDLGFVPGLLPAFPLALAAGLRRPTGDAALVVGVALGALPLVWAFQYLGGAGPQWGGRYVLVSAVLLGTVAITNLDSEVLWRGFLGVTALVTVLGLAWMAERTRAVDDLFTDLAAVDADVLVVRDAFLLREGGPRVLDEHWLTATGDETYAVALDVAEAAGARTVAVVEPNATEVPSAAVPDGWTERASGVLDFAGRPVAVAVFSVP